MAREFRSTPEYRPAPMSLAQRAALRSQQPRVLRRPARQRLYPLIILVALLVLLAAAVGGFEFLYRDRIYPNVYIPAAGVSVGGETQQAALADVYRFSVIQTFRPIRLHAGDQTLEVGAHTLGYRFDGSQTIRRAYSVGRSGNVFRRLLTQVGTLIDGTSVAIVQRVDQTELHRYLLHEAHDLNRAPGPGIAGRSLDVIQAQRLISYRLLRDPGKGFGADLPFTAIPALPKPRPVHHPPHHKKGR